jgi:hypothetical protein
MLMSYMLLSMPMCRSTCAILSLQELKDIENSEQGIVYNQHQSYANYANHACNYLRLWSGDDLRELGVTAGPKEENNMLLWGGNIRGPAPYYTGGNFKIDISFTSDYPFKAPQVCRRCSFFTDSPRPACMRRFRRAQVAATALLDRTRERADFVAFHTSYRSHL